MAQNKAQLVNISGLTGALTLPSGTTAERPSNPINGMIRYNTSFNIVEQYANGAWNAVTSPPTITGVVYTNPSSAPLDIAGGDTVTINGTSFKTGTVVKFRASGGTEYNSGSVTVVNSGQLTVTTPNVSATGGGDYDVKVLNLDGGESVYLLDAFTFNGPPTFSSPAAGNLGTFFATLPISTITIVASEPDGGSITYSVTTGSLPSGLQLNSSNGQITGSPSNVASSTTTSFTITATDDESQTATRNYSITVSPIYFPSSSLIIG
jgi:large repetitive protein